MRILGISDVEEDWLTTYYDHERMRDVDLIISCGDLPARYLEHIVTLANVPLLYVPGNHDTDYARHQPEGCISIEGGIRSFRGLHIMGLGGSLKYNGTVYGFSEQEMRWRAAKMSLLAQSTGGVDILVTHAPIRGFGDLDDLPHRGFEAFDTLVERLRPRLMLHGHIHMAYGRVARTRTHPIGTTVINVCGAHIIDIPDDELPAAGERRGLLKVDEV